MRKYLTIDSLIVALFSAVGYGLGYYIPASHGLSVLVSLIICYPAGLIIETIGEKVVFSKFVQEKPIRRIIAFVVLIICYLIASRLSNKYFDTYLTEEAALEFGFALVFAVVGFAVSLARTYFKKKKIIKKYGDGDNGVIIEEDQRKYMNGLIGRNREIRGDYDENTSVTTRTGTFVGRRSGNVISYLGIPYAKPPVGKRRWKAPEPLEYSNAVYTAEKYGPSSIQYNNEHNPLSEHIQSEDCLYLNVWTAAYDVESQSSKPVMVFLHGGDFSYGGTANPVYDGARFLKKNQDTVFVTVNSRLGVLGYIDFSDIKGGEDYPDAKNLGLLDQIEALKWIKNNIRSFGGDPDNITLAGDSAGAVSASLLAACDKAKGLFNRVILINGLPEDVYEDPEDLQAVANKLAADTDSSSMQDLSRLSWEELSRFTQENAAIVATPVADGSLIPKSVHQEYLRGATGKIDFMFINAPDEITVYKSFAGKEIGSIFTVEGIAELPVEYGEEKEAKLLAIADEKEKTLGHEESRRWLVEMMYNIVYPKLYGGIINKAGNKSYHCLWNLKPVIKNLGTGSAQITTTLLDNETAADAIGMVINKDARDVIQCMVSKFMRGEELQTFNNEIDGMSALKWKAYPYVLCIDDKTARCKEKLPGDTQQYADRIIDIILE